jgi:cation:H+ antiporter
LPAALLWLQLLAAAVLILGGARYLASASDVIARRTGLGHTFVGIVLLATATSLPELGTGISAIGLQDSPDLAAGSAFGSNMVNIFIIGIADMMWRNGPLLGSVSRAPRLVAVLGIGVIGIGAVSVFVHHQTSGMDGWYFSPLTAVLVAFFLFSTYALYRSEKGSDTPEPQPDPEQDEEQQVGELGPAIGLYFASALVVIASSVWLSYAGDGLANRHGWDESFVGTQFLAISTSLPELATSIAALRLGAPEMAVGNLLGSNLFNMGFIMAANELAYTDGTLWAAISPLHGYTALIAIGMTVIVIGALLIRSRKGVPNGGIPATELTGVRRWAKPEALLLIAIYIGASIGLFYAG